MRKSDCLSSPTFYSVTVSDQYTALHMSDRILFMIGVKGISAVTFTVNSIKCIEVDSEQVSLS